MDVDEKRLTPSELKKYDGADGMPIYVAYEGRIYDVTESRLWTGGRHMGIHQAGNDLTKSIEDAPHDRETLQMFPVVGTLIPEEAPQATLAQRVASLHPHSVVVHFPIALSTVVPLFSVLYIVTGANQFEAASYYLLLLASLSAPVGGLSGVFSWTVSYGGKRSTNFRRKIGLSVALSAISLALSVWRTLVPDILLSRGGLSYVYVLMQLVLAIVAGALGHIGGMIVFS